MKIAKYGPQSKRNSFIASIRRRSKYELMDKVRNSFKVSPITLMDVLDLWSVGNCQKFNSFAEFMREKEQQLLQLPQKHNYINLACLHQKKDCSLEKHMHVWNYLSQYLQQLHNKNEFSRVTVDLWPFLIQFIRKNSFSQIFTRELKNYGAKVVEVLKKSVKYIPKNFHQEILQWVKDKQGLMLIKQCSCKTFLSVHKFSNIYSIIDKTLLVGDEHSILICCDILSQILNYGDYNEIYQVYEKFSVIMSSLMLQVVKNSSFSAQTLYKICTTILHFLGTFDCVIIEYTKIGLGYLCSHLLKSGNQKLALQILKIQSKVKNPQILQFYLYDKEIEKQNFWHNICNNILHPIYREQTNYILMNFTNHGTFDQLADLSNKIEQEKIGSILDYIKNVMQLFSQKLSEEDQVVLEYVLKILQNYLNMSVMESEDDNPFLELCVEMDFEMQLKKLKKYKGKIEDFVEKVLVSFF